MSDKAEENLVKEIMIPILVPKGAYCVRKDDEEWPVCSYLDKNNKCALTQCTMRETNSKIHKHNMCISSYERKDYTLG